MLDRTELGQLNGERARSRDGALEALLEEARGAVAAVAEASDAPARLATILRSRVPLADLSIQLRGDDSYRPLAADGAPVGWLPKRWAQAAANGTTVVRATASASETTPSHGSIVIVPVVHDAETIAVLGVRLASRKPGIGTIRLLETVAAAIAPGIENIAVVRRQAAAVERLRELNQVTTDILAMVAHDLRGPVAAIVGFAQILAEGGDDLTPEQRARAASSIRRSSDKVIAFMNDLLRGSRAAQVPRPYRFEPFDLQALIQHTVADLAGMEAPRRCLIALEDGLPAAVGDERRQGQVLANLISNALKYSPPGSPIAVGARRHPEGLVVSVTNHGRAIREDEIGRVFERYTRLDRDDAAPVEGTGLGLFVAKQIVEAQGGRMWVDSDGDGTTFSFTVPASKG